MVTEQMRPATLLEGPNDVYSICKVYELDTDIKMITDTGQHTNKEHNMWIARKYT